MTKYFPGTKVFGPYEFKTAKETVSYQIFENWHSTGRSHNVRCGLSSNMGGSHEEGVDATHLQRFEATIGSSLGVEGIASLKSQITATTEIKVGWSLKKINTDTFNIPAPKCGSQTWHLFQLVRDYKFTMIKPRRWRKNLVTSSEIRELTFHYDMLLDDDREDPSCPCDNNMKKNNSEIISLGLGRLGIRVDAFFDSHDHLVFRIGPEGYEVDPVSIKDGPTSIALRNAPDLIRYLSGIESDDLAAVAELERDFDRTDLMLDLLSGLIAPSGSSSSSSQRASEAP